MIEIINCEQGTPEWLSLRCGLVTASEFHTVMAKGKGSSVSKTRLTYLYKLLGERITGEIQEGYSNQHMARGNEMEQEAADMYAMLKDAEPETVGFVRNGEKGCSPDRLIGNNGLLEIKTKLPHIQLALLDKGEMPTEHIAQVQGQIWVCEREWCDFFSYWPKIKPFIKRIYRDDKYIENLNTEVSKFLDELHEMEHRYRRY